MKKCSFVTLCRTFYGEDLNHEDALFVLQRVRDYVLGNGITIDDALAEIYFDEESTPQDRLNAARLLGGAPRMKMGCGIDCDVSG